MLRKPKAKRRLWVKGSCGRQSDGTAGLPPAPEIPLEFRHLRFVPRATLPIVRVRVIPDHVVCHAGTARPLLRHILG
jgi:hypothetical protein